MHTDQMLAEGQDALDRAPIRKTVRRVAWESMRIVPGEPYHIKRVIPRGLGMIFGPSGSGKTFLAAHASFCIASAREFLGHRVTAGLVAYVSPESPRSIIRRFAAWREKYGVDEAELEVFEGDINFLDGASFTALVRQLDSLAADRGAIAILVIDTLSQAIAGAEENSSEDMTRFVEACKQLQARFGCTILAIHHTGKNLSAGARGHSSLRAALDFEIEITEEGGRRGAKITKARDEVTGYSFGFELRVIPIGADQDGDEVTTCIVESTLAAADVAVSRPRRPKGAVQVLVYESLLRMTDTRCKVPPHYGPLSGVRGVTLEVLREEAYRSLQHIDVKHRSTRFASALSSLNAEGFANQRDEWVWPTRPAVTPDPPPPKGGEGRSGPRLAPITPESGEKGESGDRGKR